MKRISSVIVGLWLAVSCWALHVETMDPILYPATEVKDGVETILLFQDEIALHLTEGAADVYRVPDNTVISSGLEDFYPDEGTYYIIVGGEKEYFTVISYKAYLKGSTFKVDVTPKCRETILVLSPALTYTTSAGVTKTLNRHVSVYYTDIGWGESDWQDSAAVYTGTLINNRIHIPPFYQSTDFVLLFDSAWHEALNLPLDTAYSMITTPIAVKSHVVSTVTVRGNGSERSNEVDRPTDAHVLEARSAPLEVYFEAHPSPMVLYNSWRISRGNEVIATRSDENVRYVFTTNGGYTVVESVANDKCPCHTDDGDCEKDSTVIKLSVKESQLLVPNVFTPNGDGQNDEFRVLYRSLRDYHIWVYNRWGKLVYESTDPSKGWDGNIGSRPAAEGAYYYVIRAIGTDAAKDAGYHSRQAYEKGKLNSDDAYIGVYQLSGDINLLRGKNK